MDSLDTVNLDNLDLDTVQADKIRAFISLLIKFDKSKRLSSIKSLDDWCVNHIEDCVRAYNLIEKAECFVDVGSGNGLPGVIFSILDPKKPIVLLDNDKKKVEFLKTVAYRLDLNVKVKLESIVDFELDSVPRGTVFVYRAFSPKEIAIEFIKSMPCLKHIYFAGENQKLEICEKSAVDYRLSNGVHRKLLIF
jgi:16S rRNA (guanine527-N7)-methyltransferase